MKAEGLQQIRQNPYDLIFDPRPPQFRNQPDNRDRFRNLCINFQGNTNCSLMSAMQMFPPANPVALAKDHDYLKLSMEDQYLKDEMLSQITPDMQLEIEQHTRLQASSKQWAVERLKRITASNFGTVCKATERRDKLAFVETTNALARSLTEPKNLKTAAIVHGRRYESVAVEEYCKRKNVDVNACGLFVSLEQPFLGASPDRIVSDDILLEVKCPFVSKDRPIDEVSVPYLYSKGGSLHLKENHDYYYQVQGQLHCTGKKVCHFVVYTLCDLAVVEIPRNDEFIQSMVTKLSQFYEEYFKVVIIEKNLYKNYYSYNFEYQ